MLQNTKKLNEWTLMAYVGLFLLLSASNEAIGKGPRKTQTAVSHATNVIGFAARTLPTKSANEPLVDANHRWTQFGNQAGWKADIDLAGKPNFRKSWDRKLDEGRSQIVGDTTTIFVSTSVGIKDNDTKLTNIESKIQAIDIASQDVNWTFQFNSTMHKKQETFGGSSPAPQSTPLLIGSRLIAVSFTGQLICLNKENGKLLWQKDLVKDFGASPVQFGFSSSPVSDDNRDESFVIFAAGKSGGLLNVDVTNGNLNWKSELKTTSYATPTPATIDGVSQWLVVTEDDLVGIRKTDGKLLWNYPLTNKGLTNVPSPILVGQSSICISGQGCGGTQCVNIKKTNDGWLAKQVWSQRKVQFFYTNWLMLDQDTLLGCTDSFLAAIDVKSGKVVGRWRGFRDGNVLHCGDDVWVVDGKGTLSILRPGIGSNSNSKKVQTLLVDSKYKLTSGRCWTPISIFEKKLFIKTTNQLSCFDLESKQNGLENLLSQPMELTIDSKPPVDPVTVIFNAFEKNGQEAALKIYGQLRSDGKLSVRHRLELATAANEQSLSGLAEMILQHTVDDFPQSEAARNALQMSKGKISK